MIAEDERDIRSWMKRTLVDMGYRVVKAEDVEEALEVGRRERPGLVLTNTDLGWLDELIGLMSQDAALRFVPVAAVYPDRPEDFREDRLLVLDDYSRLEELIPAKGDRRNLETDCPRTYLRSKVSKQVFFKPLMSDEG